MDSLLANNRAVGQSAIFETYLEILMKKKTHEGYEKPSHRVIFLVYFLAIFLTGCGYIFFVPVLEGFDETGHYSSLQQISKTGEIPMRGNAFLERTIAEYKGPTAYGSGTPPFDDKLTYKKFFAAPESVREYVALYRTQRESSNYEKSESQNWQAQHPPLYYIVLSPLNKVLDGLTFIDKFLSIRIASLTIALVGVFLGMLAATRAAQNKSSTEAGLIGFAIYPVALPMFFPEFARLGNDSLCIFFVGLIAYLFSSIQIAEIGRKTAFWVGMSLGFGLLTKAFFLPISTGIIVFLLVRALTAKPKPEIFRTRIIELLYILVPAMTIGSGWYLYQYIYFGSFSGSDESIQLANQGGVILGLSNNFSLISFAKGISVTIATFVWAGTWSLTRLPDLFLAPLIFLIGGVTFFALIASRRKSLLSMNSMPLWVFVFFGIGLLWHMFVSIARTGTAATPGWYLHIFMPWLAPLIGVGFYCLLRTRLKSFVMLLIAYAVIYQITSVWAYLTLYSGCAVKGENKLFQFSDPFMCLFQANTVIENLSVLTYPKLGVTLFIFGLILQLGLICSLIRRARGGFLITTSKK